MRDFRDAKVMARALRDALKAKAVETTHTEALELIAKAFGYDNWNILSAKIEAAEPPTSDGVAVRGEATAPRNDAHSPQFPTTAPMHRALAYAVQRKHQYETPEHLLLALIDDVDASAVMKACKVDLGALKEKLTNYLDNDLKTMAINDGGEPKQSAGFQRVAQRAAHYAEGRGRLTRTGAELLVAIFAKTESPAARLPSRRNQLRHPRHSQRKAATPQFRHRKIEALMSLPLEFGR
jgi:hypothetical protein